MKTIKFATLLSLALIIFSSCDKETQLKNRLEGETWDVSIENRVNSTTSLYTGTFTFDDKEFTYSSTITDAQGNTVVTENNSYSVGQEALTVTLQDSTGSIIYNVNINERKMQEWSYIDNIDGVSVQSYIYLNR